MAFDLYPLARPLLFTLDPEDAHDRALNLLSAMQNTPLQCVWSQRRVADPVQLAGLTFPNRVGLAAGLDKNGRCIDGLGAMGFGFIEVGTVTPKAQPGNPRPRMFRLPEVQALINRFGFNNEGLDAFLAHVSRAHSYRTAGGVVGLNIGKNATTPVEQASADYALGLTAVYPHADYVTVNISSPNTKDLRSLQGDAALDALLGTLKDAHRSLQDQSGRHVPLFLKIAPDLDAEQVRVIAGSLHQHGIDGVIATNTTVSREGVAYLRHGNEVGGLSGQPVLTSSNQVISQLRQELGSDFPIIGVGGVTSPESAISKMVAGADLVQIYTGLIYHGPALVPAIAKTLKQHVSKTPRASEHRDH